MSNSSYVPLKDVRNNNKREKEKGKKNAFESSRQQVLASSNHPKESENELRTFGASATSLTERSAKRRSIGGSHCSKSLPLQNQKKRAAPAQIGFVFEPRDMCVAEDMEAEKGDRSIFLCLSRWSERRRCDWYRLDLIKKEYKKISGSAECAGTGIRKFTVATAGSIIYMHGCRSRYARRAAWAGSNPEQTSCNKVFYLDVNHPRDGWKVGPQLPYPHVTPVATSMNETVYIFNNEKCISGDIFAMALNASDSESVWKPLMVYLNMELPSTLHFVLAIPDPGRDRILLLAHGLGFFAYYPGKQELKGIHAELKKDHDVITKACAVVDGVFYHTEFDSDELLCAYDLDQRKELTPVFSAKVSFHPCDYWEQLLDLGGGKLCLVRQLSNEVVSLYLKVQREAGGNKVHITAVSFDRFRIPNDSVSVHSAAL